MNKALVWLKGNWVIVLLSLISLAVIPTAWYFANGMRVKVREDLQKKVQTDMQEIGNPSVQYNLMNVVGDKILEKRMEPNKVATELYRSAWEQIRSRTGTVSEAALAFNKAEHKILVADLFPDPKEFIAEAKLREFAAAYIRAHRDLLSLMNAGDPVEPATISAMLNDFQIAEVERVRNQTGKDPTEEEKQRIAESLRDMRIREYQRRASEIGVFAGAYVFEGVPAVPPVTKPTAAQCWDWQERYWIHQDICRAIADANKAASGEGVPGSVVKRIIRIAARPAPFLGAEGQSGAAAATEAGTDKAPIDLSRSITGRYSGPGSNNKWYDVRNVQVEIIASSRNLPEFFDALARTNFMTVLDLDIFRVDPIEELKNGYAYGPGDPVVRAVIEVETVWLREWRKDLMPMEVQKALGLVEGVAADDPFGGSAAPAPAPAPRRPAGGGDEDLGGGRGRRGGRDDG